MASWVKPPPRIILGTAKLGSVRPDRLVTSFERERGFRFLDSVLEAGCATFDLAASYLLGGTERFVGAWMASRRNRERLCLIGKGGHPYPIVKPNRLTPADLDEDLHTSLRHLRTDHLDLYLLHRDDPTASLERLVECLAAYQRQGKIGGWGVSNWTHARIEQLDALARSAGVPSVAASSPHFSLAEWAEVPWKGCVSIAGSAQGEARAFYARSQLPVLAWSALGRGYFSARRPGDEERTYVTAANGARRRRAEELARKYGATPSQIALAYLFNQPFPVSAIVSVSSAANLRTNLEAGKLSLSEAEVRWLESGDA